jgi:hypothetical protein
MFQQELGEVKNAECVNLETPPVSPGSDNQAETPMEIVLSAKEVEHKAAISALEGKLQTVEAQHALAVETMRKGHGAKMKRLQQEVKQLRTAEHQSEVHRDLAGPKRTEVALAATKEQRREHISELRGMKAKHTSDLEKAAQVAKGVLVSALQEQEKKHVAVMENARRKSEASLQAKIKKTKQEQQKAMAEQATYKAQLEVMAHKIAELEESSSQECQGRQEHQDNMHSIQPQSASNQSTPRKDEPDWTIERPPHQVGPSADAEKKRQTAAREAEGRETAHTSQLHEQERKHASQLQKQERKHALEHASELRDLEKNFVSQLQEREQEHASVQAALKAKRTSDLEKAAQVAKDVLVSALQEQQSMHTTAMKIARAGVLKEAEVRLEVGGTPKALPMPLAANVKAVASATKAPEGHTQNAVARAINRAVARAPVKPWPAPSAEVGVQVLEIELQPSEDGLGLYLAGSNKGKNKSKKTQSQQHSEHEVWVHQLEPGGVADKDGRMRCDDVLVQLNGEYLRGMRVQEVLRILGAASQEAKKAAHRPVRLKFLRRGKRTANTRGGGGARDGKAQRQVASAGPGETAGSRAQSPASRKNAREELSCMQKVAQQLHDLQHFSSAWYIRSQLGTSGSFRAFAEPNGAASTAVTRTVPMSCVSEGVHAKQQQAQQMMLLQIAKQMQITRATVQGLQRSTAKLHSRVVSARRTKERGSRVSKQRMERAEMGKTFSKQRMERGEYNMRSRQYVTDGRGNMVQKAAEPQQQTKLQQMKLRQKRQTQVQHQKQRRQVEGRTKSLNQEQEQPNQDAAVDMLNVLAQGRRTKQGLQGGATTAPAPAAPAPAPAPAAAVPPSVVATSAGTAGPTMRRKSQRVGREKGWK